MRANEMIALLQQVDPETLIVAFDDSKWSIVCPVKEILPGYYNRERRSFIEQQELPPSDVQSYPKAIFIHTYGNTE